MSSGEAPSSAAAAPPALPLPKRSRPMHKRARRASISSSSSASSSSSDEEADVKKAKTTSPKLKASEAALPMESNAAALHPPPDSVASESSSASAALPGLPEPAAPPAPLLLPPPSVDDYKPAETFAEMGCPPTIINQLTAKGIFSPSPIQAKAVPIILAGRDVIACAHTGSGKTLAFVLPAIISCLNVQLSPGQGPLWLLMGPSRELQRQTFQIIAGLCQGTSVQSTLAIGGENKSVQLQNHRYRGTHILVGTPGRIVDFCKTDVNPELVKVLVLDEGDRMLDDLMSSDVKDIVALLPPKRHTIIFSATMPDSVMEFALESLVNPVVVALGRAGAANMNIFQEVIQVDYLEKFVKLLDVMEKTPPPVLIFCSRSHDVDDLFEYLLIKGVNARAIHGTLEQSERNASIDAFKSRQCDVLVATDVASKGLDFPSVAHVICFDLPSVDAYVHRIGRTGRGGKTGFATTFIDRTNDERELADLTGLLKEAGQPIPHCLERFALQQMEGCSFCGGLTHRIDNCPKLAAVERKKTSQLRQVLSAGVGY